MAKQCRRLPTTSTWTTQASSTYAHSSQDRAAQIASAIKRKKLLSRGLCWKKATRIGGATIVPFELERTTADWFSQSQMTVLKNQLCEDSPVLRRSLRSPWEWLVANQSIWTTKWSILTTVLAGSQKATTSLKSSICCANSAISSTFAKYLRRTNSFSQERCPNHRAWPDISH